MVGARLTLEMNHWMIYLMIRLSIHLLFPMTILQMICLSFRRATFPKIHLSCLLANRLTLRTNFQTTLRGNLPMTLLKIPKTLLADFRTRMTLLLTLQDTPMVKVRRR